MPKVIILEVIWKCFRSRFSCIFDEVYGQVLVKVVSMSQHVLPHFKVFSVVQVPYFVIMFLK